MRHPIMHGNWSNNWLPNCCGPHQNIMYHSFEANPGLIWFGILGQKPCKYVINYYAASEQMGRPNEVENIKEIPEKNRFDKTNSKVAGDGWHVKDIEWNVSTSFCLNIFLQIKKLFAKWVPPRVKCCPSAATWKKAWTSIAIATWSQYFVWRGSLWKKRGFRESRGYFDIDIVCVFFFVVNLLLRGSCICNCAGKWKST